jgi:hypothetical protein
MLTMMARAGYILKKIIRTTAFSSGKTDLYILTHISQNPKRAKCGNRWHIAIKAEVSGSSHGVEK